MFRANTHEAKMLFNFRTWQFFCMMLSMYYLYKHDFKLMMIYMGLAFLFFFANEIKGGKWREEWKKRYVFKV